MYPTRNAAAPHFGSDTEKSVVASCSYRTLEPIRASTKAGVTNRGSTSASSSVHSWDADASSVSSRRTTLVSARVRTRGGIGVLISPDQQKSHCALSPPGAVRLESCQFPGSVLRATTRARTWVKPQPLVVDLHWTLLGVVVDI